MPFALLINKQNIILRLCILFAKAFVVLGTNYRLFLTYFINNL